MKACHSSNPSEKSLREYLRNLQENLLKVVWGISWRLPEESSEKSIRSFLSDTLEKPLVATWGIVLKISWKVPVESLDSYFRNLLENIFNAAWGIFWMLYEESSWKSLGSWLKNLLENHLVAFRKVFQKICGRQSENFPRKSHGGCLKYFWNNWLLEDALRYSTVVHCFPLANLDSQTGNK